MYKLPLLLLSIPAVALAGSCKKSEPSGGDDVRALAERVAKLEESQKRFAEVESFLRPIMAQQKAEADRRAASEPDPETRFAVDVSGNEFDGPAGAAVTIIEAFDFA